MAQDFSPAFAIRYVERAAAEWRRAAVDISQQFWETRLTRERAIADAALSAASDLYQPGLFDRRAERARRDGADSRADRLRASTARIAALERSAATTIRPPELVLILLP